jgi:hypothetical protein
VKVYLSRLFKKTKVRDRFELMLYRAQDRKLLNNADLTGRISPNPPARIGEYLPSLERAETVLAS